MDGEDGGLDRGCDDWANVVTVASAAGDLGIPVKFQN